MTPAPKHPQRTNGLAEAKAMLSQYLRERRLRNTPVRMALLEEIYSQRKPFTPDELLQAMEGRTRVALGTVYNSLALFEQLGIVVRVLGGSKNLFERGLGCGFVHFYRRCIQCGKVERASADELAASLQALHYTRFTAQSLSMCANGICSKCRSVLTKVRNQYLSERPEARSSAAHDNNT